MSAAWPSQPRTILQPRQVRYECAICKAWSRDAGFQHTHRCPSVIFDDDVQQFVPHGAAAA